MSTVAPERARELQLNRKLLVVVLSAAVLAASCKSPPPRQDAPADVPVPTSGSGNSAQSSGVATVNAGAGAGASAGALGPVSPDAAQRVIYFDFDSSEIRNEFVDAIAAHGRFLAGNATVRVRLEGHTDERGSREYNIGLSERRAQTVKRALALQGVQEAQIATVAYGEERPAAAGSDENAYSKNRRVEIVYIN